MNLNTKTVEILIILGIFIFSVFLSQKNKFYADYVPIALLLLLVVSDTDMEIHAISISYQIAMTIVAILLFFGLTLKYKYDKFVAFLIACLFWIIFIYIKHNFILISDI